MHSGGLELALVFLLADEAVTSFHRHQLKRPAMRGVFCSAISTILERRADHPTVGKPEVGGACQDFSAIQVGDAHALQFLF